MERLYQEFEDIAEFRMVYIREAHAADSNWSVPYAEEKGITEHDDYEERCTTAQMLLDDESLTIPCLIDSMDDAVNRAYSAWPDRIFVVRTDGRLAIAAARGPRGFEPALRETRAWLETLRDEGAETSPPSEEPIDDAAPAIDPAIATVLGEWNVKVEYPNRAIDAMLTLSFESNALTGTWSEGDRITPLADVEVDDDTLRFKRRVSAQRILSFEGKVCGDEIIGRLTNGEQEITANAVRKQDD